MPSWMLENALVATVLAGLVGSIVHWLRPRPAISHVLWLAVLVKLLVPPLALPGWPLWTVEVEGPPPVRTSEAGLVDLPKPSASPWPAVEASPAPAPAAAPTPGPATDAHWTDLLPWAWGIGGLAVAAFLLLQVLAFRRKLFDLGLVPSWLEELVAEEARHLGVSAPRISVVTGIGGPRIWPFGRPTLLWPAALATEEPEPWRAVVGHELAHLRRRDHWVIWVEILGAILWWWHPVFWLARSRMRRDAELACDAWALSRADRRVRRHFAESLIALASRASNWSLGAPGLAATPQAKRLFERRLMMIVANVPHRIPRWSAVVMLALAAVIFPSWLTERTEVSAQEAGRLEPVLTQDDDRYWEANVSEVIPWSGEQSLSVSTHVGGIDVKAGSGSGIRISARVRADKDHVDAAQVRDVFADHVSWENGENGLIIKAKHEQKAGPKVLAADEESRESHWIVDLTVEIPRALDLRVNTGVGDLMIRHGRSIDANAGVGKVMLESQSFQKVSVNVGAGDIHLTGLVEEGGDLKVGTGQIFAQIDRLPADLSLQSGVGDLHLKIPSRLAAEVHLETGIGELATPWERAAERGSTMGGKDHHVLSAGAPTLTAATGIGKVEVEYR